MSHSDHPVLRLEKNNHSITRLLTGRVTRFKVFWRIVARHILSNNTSSFNHLTQVVGFRPKEAPGLIELEDPSLQSLYPESTDTVFIPRDDLVWEIRSRCYLIGKWNNQSNVFVLRNETSWDIGNVATAPRSLVLGNTVYITSYIMKIPILIMLTTEINRYFSWNEISVSTANEITMERITQTKTLFISNICFWRTVKV